ncbi:carbon storage regulator [Thermogutta sp.]|uniref:carbon storage regulator n=1 Tax=Thermogutta sp. TaxID=1962930 RepID=UPI0032200FAC
MLVLTRRENERIVLPTVHTSIQVVRISGSTVRLGIDAPPEVPVLREELLEAFQQEMNTSQQSSAQAPPLRIAPSQRGDLPPGEPQFKTRDAYEKILDCLVVALEYAEAQLSQGNIELAHQTIHKALVHLHETRQVVAGGKTDCSIQTAPTQQGRLALVVQNVKKSQRPIAAVLERAGFKVKTVLNGCQALDYLAKNPRPDLIVFDFDKPLPARKTPCDTARTLREIRDNPELRGVKVIALGSRSPAELQVTIGPHGVDQWIPTDHQAETLIRELKL